MQELQAALTRARAAARARMTSTCTIRRKTGEKTTDGEGFEVDVWADVYVGWPCWVDWQGAESGVPVNINVGAGVEVTRARRVLKIPHDSRLVRDHDVAELTGGACDGDFFDLADVKFADQKKQQEIPITEIDRPGGWT